MPISVLGELPNGAVPQALDVLRIRIGEGITGRCAELGEPLVSSTLLLPGHDEPMTDGWAIAEQLDRIELSMKELVIAYEQYFAGVEKREPIRARDELNRQLRHFANRRIIHTELRFRYQTLASRFHTYANHWDRILRLMDEGRYVRQTAGARPPAPSPAAAGGPPDAVESVYRDLVAVHTASGLSGPPPDRRQVAELLGRQREKIRATFGDREVDFHVVTENGRPRIKVRAKK